MLCAWPPGGPSSASASVVLDDAVATAEYNSRDKATHERAGMHWFTGGGCHGWSGRPRRGATCHGVGGGGDVTNRVIILWLIVSFGALKQRRGISRYDKELCLLNFV